VSAGLRPTGWRGALRRRLVEQFHRPHGVLGRVAGFVLAQRPSNRKRNLWTVELLDLAPTDRVLELGFGPGLALEAAARRVTRGRVVGVDHSETMARVAGRRNAKAVAQGRVELRVASFDALPAFDEPFDKILAVNALIFADDADRVLSGLRSRLRPGGRIALTLQSRRPGATSADSLRGGEEIAARLRDTGFEDVHLEVLPLEPVSAVCVLGTRPKS
jgi:SAM-dependent methyltransferase